MIIYMFQCHSPKSSHPLPCPQSPKDCPIHLCLFCCLTYRVIGTIFLNSIYMHFILYWCYSFWLTSLCMLLLLSRSVVSDCATRLRRPWDSPGKNTGVGCHFLLQSLFIIGSSFIHLIRTDSNAFFLMANTPLCICTTPFLSIRLLMDI